VSEPVPRCDGCRWWAPPGDPQHWGTCGLIASTHGAAPVHPEARAIPYPDGWSGEPAILVTAADFGCVQFEPKAVGP
jgi:hypothetical protein